MTDTNTIPGTLGQTRSTWRDDNHLRGLLLKLYRQHADVDRDELEELYLVEAKGPKFRAKPSHEALIDEALRRAFDNDYARIREPARPQRRRADAKAEAASLLEKVKKTVLLDLIMPNGKALRDCTGQECSKAGGWLINIGNRIGARAIVGATLSEDEVAEIFSSAHASITARR